VRHRKSTAEKKVSGGERGSEGANPHIGLRYRGSKSCRENLAVKRKKEWVVLNGRTKYEAVPTTKTSKA